MKSFKQNYGFSEQEIHKLIKLYQSFALKEIKINMHESSLELKQQNPNSFIKTNDPPPRTPPPPTTQTLVAKDLSNKNEKANLKKTDQNKQYHQIKSFITGTFYESPSPKSNPFVKIGSIVNPETTICIIEAMKNMNEVKAGISGKIVQILVKNEQIIQQNETIMLIDTK